MRRRPESAKTTLSERQFRALCNDVAIELHPEEWEQRSQMEKRTVLLKRLLTRLQAKLDVYYGGFPPHLGMTSQETAYLSSLTNVCSVLTHYGKVAIDYDCAGTIQEELFNKAGISQDE